VHHSVRTTRMDGIKVQTADEIYLHLLESGVSAEALYDSVVKESVEIVLTAHPTQVNRRTLQHKLTQIAQLLAEKDGGRLTEEEQAANLDAIRREITALWQTDELRRRKPTPLDEARGGLHIVEQSLWAAIPDHLRRIDAALRKHTNRELPINATPIRFGSWMGGDRDGNPNVTAKVTHDVACLARWMAADLYLKEIDALRFELSMSHASDEVWRMARDIVARLSEEEGPTVASTATAAMAAAVGNSPSGDMPRPLHDRTTGKTLIRGESFAVGPNQLASLLGRRSLDGDGGIISPPVMSPRAQGSFASFASDSSTHSGISAAAALMQTNGGGSGGGMYNPGSPRAARGPNAQAGLTKGTAGAPSGMRRVDTKGTVLDPERLKQRGNQAARYHKSSIDNLIHPRAAGAAPYRIVLGEVRAKLVNTRRRMEDLLAGVVPDEDNEWYENEEDFLVPLMACYWSLWECGGGVIADGRLLDLLRRVHCFGLALMKMDLRQESTRHSDTLNEVTEHLGLGSYNEWDEEKRLEWLVTELEGRRPLIPPAMPFSGDAKEVLDTLKLAAQLGRQCLGAYVISMATRASDVLAVELLQREAKMMSLVDAGVHAKNPSTTPLPGTPEYKKSLPLRVVPLFETLTDLDAAGGVMTRLMQLPWYRRHLEEVHDNHQEVMLGYSDSGKDAGRLAAAWALYACQEDLVKVCKEAGVKLTLFHGRGGTIGRGGGPMLLAIQSQPPGSVQGSIRITEQGEMVQAKFGVPAVARRQLEIYNNAVLLATLDPPKPPKDESWRQVMDTISKHSCAAYRAVVFEDPLFIRYFQKATPQEELANLNIGSRPARRKAGGDVTTLRAIPWIFAWTQTRMVLPSWLGVADGIAAVVNDGNRSALKDMYEHWPFFQSVVDLIEMVLTKADMRIASLYDQHLVQDPAEQALGDALRRRYIDTVRAVLSITGHARLGDNNPTLRHLIAMRNPHVDPLNVMQVEILRRLRLDDTNQSLRDALLITINGIAAGMVSILL
jgi:phosphoenolpyruvate carboxylase